MPGQDLAALLQLEGLPSDTSREAYVQHAVQRVCVEDVQWQSASFAQVRSHRASSSSVSFSLNQICVLLVLAACVIFGPNESTLYSCDQALACGYGLTMPA